MLSQLLYSPLVANLLSFFALTPIRAITYGAVAFVTFTIVWYLLWLLPIHAWFRKPMELSPECPLCGSKNFRPSHVHNSVDRFRKKLGLLPFRCRGCTQRFISRSSRNSRHDLPTEVELG